MRATQPDIPILVPRFVPKLVAVLLAMPLFALLNGCVVVGYSSQGGAFFWPGGLGLGLMLLLGLLWMLLRHR